MPYISNVYARQVLDSRGFPTIQVEVTTESGFSGSAIVPSGASTGKYEALELRDNDDARYRGKSVFKAINNVNETIAKLIKEKSVLEQREIDLAMIRFDNTENKEKLGANAMLAVSLAVANCAANYLEIPLYRYLGGCNAHVLPTPMINIVNGGSHATNSLDFQEFMIMPISANSFYQAMEMATNVFHTLKDILKRSNLATSVGDEGGFAPNLESNDDALELIIKAIKECNYEPGKDISIALDVAASELYQNGIYTINGKQYTSDELIKYYEQLVSKYPIISIEDGLDQEDYTGWKKLTSRLGAKIQLVGDDLFVTNTNRLKAGIAGNYSNSILIKLNQIGTLSETIDCIEMAVKNQIATIISHRSGESEDTFISDLAVGLNIGQIKTGSMSRSERICKYNRLLKIEDHLVGNSCYQGKINNK
ncbi:MAG TPA: phosphopyruvate hydratase [Thomasclavelia ramosa]|nr:phosphopyruvate hydratase [Thomasclavelia ramosa]